MPRKPNAPSLNTTTVVVSENASQAAAAHDALAQMTASYSADRDLVNQLLGQAQMADAFEKFSRTVRASKLAYVRENKLYQALKGMPTANGSRFSGTWEDFCTLLGTSRDTVELDIANLKAFGAEALESMSQMGIGYRELRQFRRLPDDSKAALIEVAKSGDKEALLELAETLIERSQRERAVLEAELQEAQEGLEAKDKVIESQAAKLTAHEERLARPFKPKKGNPAQDADEAAALDELFLRSKSVAVEILRLAVVVRELQSNPREPMRQRALDAMRHVVTGLREIAQEHGLDVDTGSDAIGGRPSWLNLEALQQAAADADAADDANGQG